MRLYIQKGIFYLPSEDMQFEAGLYLFKILIALSLTHEKDPPTQMKIRRGDSMTFPFKYCVIVKIFVGIECGFIFKKCFSYPI